MKNTIALALVVLMLAGLVCALPGCGGPETGALPDDLLDDSGSDAADSKNDVTKLPRVDLKRAKELYAEYSKGGKKDPKNLSADDALLFTIGLMMEVERTMPPGVKLADHAERLGFGAADDLEQWGENLRDEGRPLTFETIEAHLQDTGKPLVWRIAFREYLRFITKQRALRDAYEIGLTKKDIERLKNYLATDGKQTINRNGE